MDLAGYFENARGLGVLGTANKEGKVNLAVYARPYVTDESTIAFVMSERLSHQNLRTNPRAAYIFIEEGHEYKGVRLYLTEAHEEMNTSRIDELRRQREQVWPVEDGSNKYLVCFRVERIRPLVGDWEKRFE